MVRGTLTEVRPTPAGLRSRGVEVGEVQTVAPGSIHDVDNRHTEPAVSIHAYSPRLTRMTFYEAADDHVRPTRTIRTGDPEETP